MFGRKGLVLFFFCSFGVFFIKPVFAGDILDGPILERAFRSEIRALFDDEDFASLESVADDLRRTKARFPSGTWKLAHFYDALNSPDVPNLPAWEELGIRIHRWTQSFPKSVTAQVAMGNFWLAFAWDARGNGSAATITEEGGRLWRERLEKAYHILRAGPVSPGADCPGRIASCLELGKAMGWNRLTFDAMFEQGVLLEPGYESYYLIKAAYLMPRWYGRPGEWQKFADKATSLTPPSEGEAIYARIAWATSRYYQSDFFGSEVGVSWGRMKQGFIDMEKRFAGSRWNLNHFCKFACLAGDRETASSLFERIGENPYIEAWESYGIFEKWRKWAIPFPGKRGGRG